MEPEPLKPGSLLNGRYVIAERLYTGALGSTYLARETREGARTFVVRETVLLRAGAPERARIEEGFTREARLLSSFEHASIRRMTDHFVVGDRFYFVFEQLRTVSLTDVQRERGGRVDELTVTRWAKQISSALAYLHGRNPPVVHRYLEPDSIRYDRERDRVFLDDLSYAMYGPPAPPQALFGQYSEPVKTPTGTMGYLAPELFAGRIDPRSDLYALGATMFHLLTGSDPRDDPLLIFDFTRNPTARQINPKLSARIDEILTRLVAHKPEARYESAAELLRVLEAHEQRMAKGPGA